MYENENLDDRNFSKRKLTFLGYYMFLILAIVLIVIFLLISGCNPQTIFVEQPFIQTTDKCFCEKIIKEKVLLQNDKGFNYLFKDVEGYKTITDGVQFDTVKIGSKLIANWYTNIIIK